MIQIVVLFANEPLSYRQALAAVVKAVRQEIDTHIVSPEELDEHLVAPGRSCLVICSQLTEAITTHALGWILLYPDGIPRVEINVAGNCTVNETFELDDLLTLIDLAIVQKK